MKKAIYAVLLTVLVVGSFLAGTWYRHRLDGGNAAPAARKILYYVDPMHPAYKSDKPGIAPDCGMELVPVYEDGSTGGGGGSAGMPPGSVNISSEKQQLLGVRVASVERVRPIRTIRTIGRVTVDENRIHRIVGGADGWLNELHGGTTGSLVQQDQLLASYISKDLVNNQQALFISLGNVDRLKAAAGAEDHAAATGQSPVGPPRRGPAGGLSDQVTLANQQLRLAEATLLSLGMSEAQLAEMKRTRQPARQIEIRAPATGLVVARSAAPGLRFDRSTELYRIADLSKVWIVADLFENEAQYFRPGVTARLTLSGTAGKVRQARVTDVLPLADLALRTLKVRLEIDNPDYALRPDMVVDVELPVELPPMIALPAEAVLDTGLKQMVFVEREAGVFEPRQVTTGWRTGEQIEILHGLQPGERIVVSGTFLLDSESRMKAAAAGIYGEAATDPVCGMVVDQSRTRAAGRTVQYQGQTFYFCSDECKTEFQKAPAGFAEKAKAPGPGTASREPPAAKRETRSEGQSPGAGGSPAGHAHER